MAEPSAPSRREFLVTLMGVTLGAFFMPASDVEAASEDSDSPLPRLDILGLPAGGRDRDGFPYVVYVRGDGETMVWWAADEEEFADLRRFYLATRNPGCPNVSESDVFPIKYPDEQRRLLASIARRPEDDSLRLRYAKWLEQQGDPRGEFIRVDLMTDRISESDPRYKPALDRYWELLDQHGETWFRPLAALGLWPTMGAEFCPYYWLRRGVIDWVEVNVAGVLPDKTKLLFQAAPAITQLSIQVDNLDVAAIVARPELRQIRSLAFSPHFASTFLEQEDDPSAFSCEGMRALVNSKNLPQLESLDVSSSRLGDDGFKMLVASPLFSRLLDLNVGFSKLTCRAVELLESTPATSRIERFKIYRNELGGEGVRRILLSSKFARLKELDVQAIDIEPQALDELPGAAPDGLEILKAALCSMGDSNGQSLLDWLSQSALIEVDFENNDFSAAVVSSLRKLKHLRRLDLNNNPIGDEGAKELAALSLETLSIDQCGITASGVEAIASAAQLGGLQRLNLQRNDIGVAGAEALAKSPYLGQLASLVVGTDTVGEEGAKLLRKRFGDAVALGEDSEVA